MAPHPNRRRLKSGSERLTRRCPVCHQKRLHGNPDGSTACLGWFTFGRPCTFHEPADDHRRHESLMRLVTRLCERSRRFWTRFCGASAMKENKGD